MLMAIDGYCINVIGEHFIGGYYIVNHWQLFYQWLLMAISAYFINGYQWLFYYKLLFVTICYIMTIGDYCIINYCWIFYVIIS